MATEREKVIWKWPLPTENWPTIVIEAPANAEWLTVQLQGEMPTLWALVDPVLETEQYRFTVCGTEHAVPVDAGKYLGTVQIGWNVWHVFCSL